MMIEGSFERSLSAVLEQLKEAGYTESFSGEGEAIRALGSGTLYRPEDLAIEKVERFEGMTDPDEETIILAIRCRPHNIRGTYILPYGKDMPSIDAAIVARIPDTREPAAPLRGRFRSTRDSFR
jgi:hypothetical protein